MLHFGLMHFVVFQTLRRRDMGTLKLLRTVSLGNHKCSIVSLGDRRSSLFAIGHCPSNNCQPKLLHPQNQISMLLSTPSISSQAQLALNSLPWTYQGTPIRHRAPLHMTVLCPSLCLHIIVLRHRVILLFLMVEIRTHPAHVCVPPQAPHSGSTPSSS
jgi:hypothetical protein